METAAYKFLSAAGKYYKLTSACGLFVGSFAGISQLEYYGKRNQNISEKDADIQFTSSCETVVLCGLVAPIVIPIGIYSLVNRIADHV